MKFLKILLLLAMSLSYSCGGGGAAGDIGAGGGSDLGSWDTFPELPNEPNDKFESITANGETIDMNLNGMTETELNSYVDTLITQGFERLTDGKKGNSTQRDGYYIKVVDGARHIVYFYFLPPDVVWMEQTIIYDIEAHYNSDKWWETEPISANPKWAGFSEPIGSVVSREYSRAARGIVLEQIVTATEAEMAEYRRTAMMNWGGTLTQNEYTNTGVREKSHINIQQIDATTYKLTYSVTDTRTDPQIASDPLWAAFPAFNKDKELYTTYSQANGLGMQMLMVGLPEMEMKEYMDKLTDAGFVRYTATGAHTKWQNNKRYTFSYSFESKDQSISLSVVDELPNPDVAPQHVIISPKLVKDDITRTYTIHYIPEGSEESCTAVERSYYVDDDNFNNNGLNIAVSNMLPAKAKTWVTNISYLYLYRGRQSTSEWNPDPAAYAFEMTCKGQMIEVFENMYWDEYHLPSYEHEIDNVNIPIHEQPVPQ
jgi:hypothetical protein